jgi:methylglutaconyl-CoA hydratase
MHKDSSQGFVRLTEENEVGYLRFYHPAHNAMPADLLQQLWVAIQAADASNNIKVIVLESEGDRSFCAGASFDELAMIADREGGKRFFMGFAQVINAMRRSNKLIIARIQGKAIGGGVGLASAADYCLATQHAAIKLSELAVGIGPFVIGPAVERKMGKAAFSQLAINATEFMPAEWAREQGLYQEVVEDIHQLDARVEALSARLAASSPEAMAQLKRVLWEGTEHWDSLLESRAAISGELILTPYSSAAIAAFRQKK